MIKIIFFGTPHFVLPVIKTLSENFDVVGIVTTPDQKVGRKQILTPSPVKQYALEKNIPVITPDNLKSEDLKSYLINLNSDLFIVAAYGKIIPQNILDIPKEGSLNIHPSLLPKYRGPSPIQSAILNGDKTTGISIIKMDEKMDHGPIVYMEEFSITSLDNFQTLSTKMFERSTLFLPKIIPAYVAGKIKLTEQNEMDATYCKIIKKEDGYFDLKNFSDSPNFLEKLDRDIRAYYPWPTAWTRWEGKIVKFLPFCHPEQSEGSIPDSSLITQNDKYLLQIEGKKPVKLDEFLRGYPDFPLKDF
ncbi:MAG: methionyl-tRNA formyltransferase [Candidatus Daviesbacteria bacterium]|nr:methionyl-tRNA formyltransferase [Candidatus Daviesbacteria bacterium]